MIGRIRENIAVHRLLAEGERVAIAVSGGVDSMVLLQALRSFPFDCAVLHFNHRLRGDESDADERFVRATAEQLGLPCLADSADVRAKARGSGISIEMAARELRHAFFARAAREFGAGVVALAHHADDQVETFWHRLLRGEVGSGLGGMRWRSPSPADPGIWIVRPFLNVFRSEIEAHARGHAIAYREDSSNRNLDHERNRIRHEILPALERYQPRLRAISLRAMEVLRDEKDFVEQSAGSQPFLEAHPAIQRILLRRALLKAGVQPSFALIEALRNTEHPISVRKGMAVARRPDGTLSLENAGSDDYDFSERDIELSNEGRAEFGGVDLSWKQTELRARTAPGVEYFDVEAVGRVVTLRHWRPGDRFEPIGLGGSIKLQDLFTNLKVPRTERHRRVLAASSTGQIFWVEGARIAEWAKIRPGTRCFLEWRWHR